MTYVILLAMKRLLAFVGLALFFVGVVLLPVVHCIDLDHCDTSASTGSHIPEDCAVCALATTAIVVACTCIAIAFVQDNARTVFLPDLLVQSLFIPQGHLARAPPAA